MRWKIILVLFSLILGANIQAQPMEAVNHLFMDVDERVDCELSVQNVYRRARHMGKQHDDVAGAANESRARERVLRRLKMDRILRERWQYPITAAMVESEYRRIIENTRRPDLLSDLSQALDDDKRRIAECLVRPLLTEQVFNNLYGSDQDLHAETADVAQREVEQFAIGAPLPDRKVRTHVIREDDPQYDEAYQKLIVQKWKSRELPILSERAWVGGELTETPRGFSAVRARLGATGAIELEQYSLPKMSPRNWLATTPGTSAARTQGNCCRGTGPAKFR